MEALLFRTERRGSLYAGCVLYIAEDQDVAVLRGINYPPVAWRNPKVHTRFHYTLRCSFLRYICKVLLPTSAGVSSF